MTSTIMLVVAIIVGVHELRRHHLIRFLVVGAVGAALLGGRIYTLTRTMPGIPGLHLAPTVPLVVGAFAAAAVFVLLGWGTRRQLFAGVSLPVRPKPSAITPVSAPASAATPTAAAVAATANAVSAPTPQTCASLPPTADTDWPQPHRDIPADDVFTFPEEWLLGQ